MKQAGCTGEVDLKALIRRVLLGEQPEVERKKKVEKSEGPNEVGEAAELFEKDENNARHQYPVIRLLSVLLLLTMALNLSLAAAVLWLFPLKTVKPIILQVHPDGYMVVDMQPLHGADVPAARIVIEGVIERYIIEREEIIEIHDEMERRWLHPGGYVATHTAPKLYKRFTQDAKNKLKEIKIQPYRSVISVESIVPVAEGSWNYKVLFKAESSLGHLQRSTVDTKFWEATVSMAKANRTGRDIPLQDLRRNPFGFYVTGYDLREQRRRMKQGKS